MRKLIVMTAVLSCCGLAFGQVWNEAGDAGQNNIGEAQTPVGAGPLTAIVGRVGGANDVDLYGPIVIVDAPNFLADTRGGAAFDTQLFLFDAAGLGVVHNDDVDGLQSVIGGQAGFPNGEYYLGISAFNADPRDADGGAIFSFATFPGPLPGQRMPNADAGPLAAWTTSGATGDYTISLRGVEYIPEPASLVLLGLGGLALIRRR